MKQITLPSGEYLLVQVPDAFRYYILESTNNNRQGLFWKDGTESPPWEILPPGNWQIIGKADQLTEDEWKGILPLEDLYWELQYRNYPLPGQELEFQEHIAESVTKSGHSLIASHSMKPETTLILKKIESEI